MKIIIIGLGNFGFSLGVRLCQMGHDVIGVDNNERKTEDYKNLLTSTICLDALDSYALKELPLEEADVVVVAIGEDIGASIQITAQLKVLRVKKLISRSFSPIHTTVLQAIGIDDIVTPEKEYAAHYASGLEFSFLSSSYGLNSEFGLFEIRIPASFVGKKVEDLGLQNHFNFKLVCLKRIRASSFLLRPESEDREVIFPKEIEVFNEGDIIVVCCTYSDLRKARSLFQD